MSDSVTHGWSLEPYWDLCQWGDSWWVSRVISVWRLPCWKKPTWSWVQSQHRNWFLTTHWQAQLPNFWEREGGSRFSLIIWPMIQSFRPLSWHTNKKSGYLKFQWAPSLVLLVPVSGGTVSVPPEDREHFCPRTSQTSSYVSLHFSSSGLYILW